MDNEIKDKSDSSNNKNDKFSIFNLAKQLENRSISPLEVNKQNLKKCAELFKSRGYSNSDIGQILEVDEKTIQRYIKDQREENAIVIGTNFQRQLVGEVIRTWRAQYYRLLKLSYSEDLTANEVMKSIYLAHQVQKDGIDLLERLGYLSKSMAMNDINKDLQQAKMEEQDVERKRKKSPSEEMIAKLSADQGKKIGQFLIKKENEAYEEANKMVESFAAENEKNKTSTENNNTK